MNTNELSFLGSLRKIGFSRANELLSFALAYEGAESVSVIEVVKPARKLMAQPMPKIPAELDAQLVELCTPKKKGGRTANPNSLSSQLRKLYLEQPTAVKLSPKLLRLHYVYDYPFLKDVTDSLIYEVRPKAI